GKIMKPVNIFGDGSKLPVLLRKDCEFSKLGTVCTVQIQELKLIFMYSYSIGKVQLIIPYLIDIFIRHRKHIAVAIIFHRISSALVSCWITAVVLNHIQAVALVFIMQFINYFRVIAVKQWRISGKLGDVSVPVIGHALIIKPAVRESGVGFRE